MDFSCGHRSIKIRTLPDFTNFYKINIFWKYLELEIFGLHIFLLKAFCFSKNAATVSKRQKLTFVQNIV